MRRRCLAAGLLAVVCAGVPRTAVAQTKPEPQLLLTMFGGALTGKVLYENLRQPLFLLEDPASIDTLSLDRRLSPAIVLGASATYFPSPALGLTGEIVFLGFGLDDSCDMTYTAPGPPRPGSNEQICADIASKSTSASTIGFYGGALYRPLRQGTVRPYLRAVAGIATRNRSTVAVSGAYLTESATLQERLVIDDPDPGSLAPSASFGLGFMIAFAPGYQARLEFRDHLLYADRVTGPANAFAEAPTERTLVNSMGLVLMLDIVLEQRRGRRY